MNSSFISTTEGVHIWHKDCLWGVDYNIGVLSPLLALVSKDKVKYTYNQFMACYAIFFIFDQWCSYLAQLLLMVCKLQSTLHITAMALEPKSNWNLSYSGMFLKEVLHIL